MRFGSEWTGYSQVELGSAKGPEVLFWEISYGYSRRTIYVHSKATKYRFVLFSWPYFMESGSIS
jgi:hypothetical protein